MNITTISRSFFYHCMEIGLLVSVLASFSTPSAATLLQDEDIVAVLKETLEQHTLFEKSNSTVAVLPAGGDVSTGFVLQPILEQLGDAKRITVDLLSVNELTSALPAGKDGIEDVPVKYEKLYIEKLIQKYNVTHLLITEYITGESDVTRTIKVLNLESMGVIHTRYDVISQRSPSAVMKHRFGERRELGAAKVKVILSQCVSSINALTCDIVLVNRSFTKLKIERVMLITENQISNPVHLRITTADIPTNTKTDEPRSLQVSPGEMIRIEGSVHHTPAIPVQMTVSIALDLKGDQENYRYFSGSVTSFKTRKTMI